MEINEIKKILYKNNNSAFMSRIKKGIMHYDATLDNKKEIRFEIPISEIMDAEFLPVMAAKHLIRWIKLDEEVEKVD